MLPASADGRFPWYLVFLFELLHASICYPTPNIYVRQWILAPAMVAIAIRLYTKCAYLQGSTAYMIGSNTAFQLCSMTYLVYIQKGFPDFWRRVIDENSGDENKLPSKFSFRRKMVWTLDLNFGVRRVGWVQEAKGALPPRPNCSRMAYIRSRMFYGLMHVLTFDLVIAYQTRNPAFDTRVHHVKDGTETYIRGQALLLRIPNLVSWGLGLVCGLSLAHTVISVISIGLGFSEPADWPCMFGSFQDAYTLRQFWGRVWHQRMRSMLSGVGKYVAHNMCRFNQGTNLSSYTQLYIAFFLSGLIHAGGDYMVLGYLPLFSPRFFLLQAVAISFEDLIIWVATPLRSKMDHRVNRTVGYLWVAVWLCWAGPLWLDPMSASGIHDNDRGAIFGRV